MGLRVAGCGLRVGDKSSVRTLREEEEGGGREGVEEGGREYDVCCVKVVGGGEDVCEYQALVITDWKKVS